MLSRRRCSAAFVAALCADHSADQPTRAWAAVVYQFMTARCVQPDATAVSDLLSCHAAQVDLLL